MAIRGNGLNDQFDNDLVVLGNLTANCETPTADKQLANKKYVDDNAGGVTELNDLSDVDTTGVADEKILKYNSGTSKFEIADAGGSSLWNETGNDIYFSSTDDAVLIGTSTSKDENLHVQCNQTYGSNGQTWEVVTGKIIESSTNLVDFGVKGNQYSGGFNFPHEYSLRATGNVFLGNSTNRITVVPSSETRVYMKLTVDDSYDFQNRKAYNTSGTGRDVYVTSGGLYRYNSSTKEDKTNIIDEINTSWIYDIEVKNFEYKKIEVKDEKEIRTKEGDGIKRIGIIAEQAYEINPISCIDYIEDDGTIVGVNKEIFIFSMLKEIQNLKKEIENLKTASIK